MTGISDKIHFVTGGTGLVGSHLLSALLKKGYKVRALRRPGSDFSVFSKYFAGEDIETKVDWVNGDVNDYFSLADALTEVGVVYHCAAMVSFSPRNNKEMMRVNINGTTNVVNACLEAGIKRLCHVSSVAAIGRTSDNKDFITEEDKWTSSSANSAYAESKFRAEREVWRGIAEGLDAVIVNPSIILGPCSWERGSGKIFGTVKKGLKFYTEGVNAFVDVRDVVNAMIALTESGISSERFVVAGENLSYRDVFSMVAAELKVKPPSIKISKLATEVFWRMEAVRKVLFGANPIVTKETARTSHQKNYYSTEKLNNILKLSFTPIHDTIRFCCERE